MGGYLDAAADRHHRRSPGRGGDGDGAHLVVEAIVVPVVDDEVEDVRHRLAARLEGSDVPEDGGIGWISPSIETGPEISPLCSTDCFASTL